MQELPVKFTFFLATVFLLHPTIGIRFVIDREECFSHSVPYEGDTVHVSFVVIKAETPWHYGDEGVDLVVRFVLLWIFMLNSMYYILILYMCYLVNSYFFHLINVGRLMRARSCGNVTLCHMILFLSLLVELLLLDLIHRT